MLFSSITFIYYFLPVVLLVYLIMPKGFKYTVLLAASLLFYAWGEPKYVVLMIAEILVGYISGLFLEYFTGTGKARLILFVSVSLPVGLLFYFKYAGFFIETFNQVIAHPLQVPTMALPIGISFYTFQIISYQVDVYRKTVRVQKSLIAFAAYVAMFPQLVAGPIVRYAEIENQFGRTSQSIGNMNWEQAAIGLRRFILGLSKKVLFADRLGELCTLYRNTSEPSVLFAWLYAIAFMLQIYFDFSGYSDMAIGLGHLLGFDFPENFRYPYMADSITDFWRRWHISLSRWFRDYVYIPLGGSHFSHLKQLRNILIVWLLTGLWHGASWTFVIWGLYFAFFLVIEKCWLLKRFNGKEALRHIYVLFVVMTGFVIFNAADMREAVSDIGRLFGRGGLALISDEACYYIKSYAVTLLAACIGATPFIKKAVLKLYRMKQIGRLLAILEPIFLLLLLAAVTACLIDSTYNPFLYFRF